MLEEPEVKPRIGLLSKIVAMLPKTKPQFVNDLYQIGVRFDSLQAFLFSVSIFLSILSGVSNLIFPGIAGVFVGNLTKNHQMSKFDSNLVFLFTSVLVVQSVINFIRVYYLTRIAENVVSQVKIRVFTALMRTKDALKQRTNPKEVISRLNFDLTVLNQLLAVSIPQFVSDLFTIFVGFFYS
jgi:ABC-type multidrug transport system fused ATPase/permease subunit